MVAIVFLWTVSALSHSVVACQTAFLVSHSQVYNSRNLPYFAGALWAHDPSVMSLEIDRDIRSTFHFSLAPSHLVSLPSRDSCQAPC